MLQDFVLTNVPPLKLILNLPPFSSLPPTRYTAGGNGTPNRSLNRFFVEHKFDRFISWRQVARINYHAAQLRHIVGSLFLFLRRVNLPAEVYKFQNWDPRLISKNSSRRSSSLTTETRPGFNYEQQHWTEFPLIRGVESNSRISSWLDRFSWDGFWKVPGTSEDFAWSTRDERESRPPRSDSQPQL